MALEGCFALKQPAGYPQQESGVVTSQRKRGINESIRLDERAVEVDAERRKDGSFESRTGDRQEGPFLENPSDYRTRNSIYGQRKAAIGETFKPSYTSLSFILRFYREIQTPV